MTLFSRKVDYALLILSYLYRQTGTARGIAERFGLSRSFTANILKELGHHGFVVSQRGVKGGYALARPARQITLAEVIEALEDGWRLTLCSGNTPHPEVCEFTHCCTLQGPLAEVHQRLLDVLRGVTLADLFEGHGCSVHVVPARSLPVLEMPALAADAVL
ncbi:RrF2 family transcriptional regulator [Thermogemmata fonticola]|jgi:Rrf2 family protein|uniref:Rrf2 family transcriptional regulator n=1 Tax=Thermogemmata fonticola TaxID=2755323 RepID=A0A7V8VD52_9BACT|nr:Rrf2 family transcriptional regulator [Thermogemmata fonticola]MBA2225854.1 Rrf2 family transcriptional regulator [Thermogemmata fonticola]